MKQESTIPLSSLEEGSRGRKVYEKISGRRFERTSIVAGQVDGEFIAPHDLQEKHDKRFLRGVVQNATPTCFEDTSCCHKAMLVFIRTFGWSASKIKHFSYLTLFWFESY